MKKFLLFGMALSLLAPVALALNEGATVTAPFLATPPTIDGVVSAGEWDDAAVASGEWSEHSSDLTQDPLEPTVVKIAYSVDGLYILFECTDTNVAAAAGGSEINGQNTFSFGGDTDYLAVYLDPLNYADDALNSAWFSYSIQAEPGVTVNAEDESYTYSEVGQFGRFRNKFDPPLDNGDGTLTYWGGGVTWDLSNTKIVDGPTDDGYAMEWFISWTDLNGYYANYGSEVLEAVIDVGLEQTDPFNVLNGIVHGFFLDGDNVIGNIGFGNVTGMPMPGTAWKIQLARYTEAAAPQYTNWVGDTGGFVSRPFGNLIFGEASGSAVREALIHMSSN